MLRQGVWISIVIMILSVLTACPHKEIIGGGDALKPQNESVEQRPVPVEPSVEPKNGLVGRWEAIEPKSGLVNILEFHADGTSKSSLLVRVNMHYHIEGDKLIMTPDNKPADKETGADHTEAKQDGSEPVIDTFVLKNDRLTLTLDKTGEFVELQREGQATEPNSIVGIWSFKLQSGESGREIFYADGTNEIKSPLPGGTEGLYEVKEGVMTVTSPDKKHSQSVKYKQEGGKLALDDGKKITNYIRLTEPK